VTELQQNRYDQLLRRVGDLKGPGSKVNDVLQELFPTIDVENVPGELLFLLGTRIGWGAAAKAPTAGKKAAIQLFNPEGSGQLVTVSTVLISGATLGDYTWGTSSSGLGTNTGIPRLRDLRLGSNEQGVSQLRTSADQVAQNLGRFRSNGGLLNTLTDGNSFCVLSPGTGITIVGDTDVVISVSFFYRERIAEPSELAF